MAPRRRSIGPSELALDLYAAVLDGQALDGPIAAIADALGARMALAQRVALRSDVASEGHLTRLNIDPQVLTDYQNGWIRHDPWLRKAHALAPGVHNLSRLLPPDELLRTTYWNEFLLHRAPTFHGLSLLVHQPQDVTGVVTFWRDRGGEAFAGGSEALLQELEPHIRRALIAESRLAGATRSLAALDALHQGVAVISAAGRLVHCNAALLSAAAEADGIALTPGGIVASSTAAQERLDALVAGAIGGTAAPAGNDRRLALPRPSGLPPWAVEVLPLRPGGDGAFARWSGAVVFVTDASAQRAPGEQQLIIGYGLTPAEASLAVSLAKGMTLAEHARRRRITLPTARTHLARIFEKTGCRRQSELTARLAALGA